MKHSPKCLQKSPRPEPKQLRNSTKQGFHCGESGRVFNLPAHPSQTTLVSSIYLSVSGKLMTFKSKHGFRPMASLGFKNIRNTSSAMKHFLLPRTLQAGGLLRQLLDLIRPAFVKHSNLWINPAN